MDQDNRVNLTSGTRLGHFEIVEAIGAGGMGQVYRARDALDRAHREGVGEIRRS